MQVSALVALQRGVVGNKSQACKHLQNVIQYQQERLDQVEAENVCSILSMHCLEWI